MPIINKLMHEFEHVILTQDWHPAHHSSFASSHPGKNPFETIEMPYGPQTLWPDHCIQGTDGAAFHPHFVHDKAELIIRKGFRTAIDSYSAFFENDHTTQTGLAGYLRERGIRTVTIAGLATDYCVAYSALDSVGRGFTTNIRLDACRGIDLGGSIATMTIRDERGRRQAAPRLKTLANSRRHSASPAPDRRAGGRPRPSRARARSR